MKLSGTDRFTLLSYGYVEQDFPQIEQASAVTVITLSKPDGTQQRLSAEEASDLMGRCYYLNRLARAAFHRTSGDEVEGMGYVSFDASALFDGLKIA